MPPSTMEYGATINQQITNLRSLRNAKEKVWSNAPKWESPAADRFEGSPCFPETGSGINYGDNDQRASAFDPSTYNDIHASLVMHELPHAAVCGERVRMHGTYWPWYANNGCTKIVDTTEVYTYTTDDPDDGLITTTSKDKYGVNAYAVTIRYQSADHLPPTTSATTTSASASPTSTTSQTQSASSSPDSYSLSTGAKAGIGVGVAAGVILLVVAAAIWFFRRRWANAAAASDTNGTENPVQSNHFKAELVGTQVYPTAELAGSQPFPGQTLAHHVPAPEPVELGTGKE
ncbi:hypothetical protein N8T08_005256 [Aspergillus melleus]|uniref:Uncharacterized protein n=1 Tax=Aspergillus melleus TaxID=138277 RepID=A0ACC3BFR7_9EURO|nr:hypothetical protein N8T08_005256 [Aspergillus melleus]